MITLDKLLSLYESKEYCNYRNNNQDMDQSTDTVNKNPMAYPMINMTAMI
jgi:hypothetical protein